jgi:hypothetical protein
MRRLDERATKGERAEGKPSGREGVVKGPWRRREAVIGRGWKFEQSIPERGAVGGFYRTKNSQGTWRFKTAIIRLTEARGYP